MNSVLSVASLASATMISSPSVLASRSDRAAVDPAFAAIARHRKEDRKNTLILRNEPPHNAPERAGWDRLLAHSDERLGTALDEMLDTVPTTRKGAEALLKEFCRIHGRNAPDGADALRLLESFLQAVPENKS